MESMSVIQAATTLPILRPVVAFDKQEIIEVAKRINTYTISIEPYADCCTLFAVTNPITRPRLADVLAEEAKVDGDAWLDPCLASCQTIVAVEKTADYL